MKRKITNIVYNGDERVATEEVTYSVADDIEALGRLQLSYSALLRRKAAVASSGGDTSQIDKNIAEVNATISAQKAVLEGYEKG